AGKKRLAGRFTTLNYVYVAEDQAGVEALAALFKEDIGLGAPVVILRRSEARTAAELVEVLKTKGASRTGRDIWDVAEYRFIVHEQLSLQGFADWNGREGSRYHVYVLLVKDLLR